MPNSDKTLLIYLSTFWTYSYLFLLLNFFVYFYLSSIALFFAYSFLSHTSCTSIYFVTFNPFWDLELRTEFVLEFYLLVLKTSSWSFVKVFCFEDSDAAGMLELKSDRSLIVGIFFFEARLLSTIDFWDAFLEKVFIFLWVANFELFLF